VERRIFMLENEGNIPASPDESRRAEISGGGYSFFRETR
jgi:hypothetical protein